MYRLITKIILTGRIGIFDARQVLECNNIENHKIYIILYLSILKYKQVRMPDFILQLLREKQNNIE